MENKLIKLISNGILNKHGNKILSIALFGSRANGSAKKYSDYDFIVITRGIDSTVFFIFDQNNSNKIEPGKDIKITIFYVSEKKAIRNIKNIESLDWSNKVNMLLNNKIIKDDKGLFKRFAELYQENKDKDILFNKLAAKWFSLAFEYLCKLNNSPNNLNLRSYLKWQFLFCIINYFKSLNKDYLKSNYTLTTEIEDFKLCFPEFFIELENFLSTDNIDIILLNNFWEKINNSKKIKIDLVDENNLIDIL